MAIFNPDGTSGEFDWRRIPPPHRRLTPEHVMRVSGRPAFRPLAARSPRFDEIGGQWGGTMRKPGGVGYR